MRMFQLCICGEPLQFKEQPTPKPAGSEVLLRVLAEGRLRPANDEGRAEHVSHHRRAGATEEAGT
jgi:hypothetical protein